MLLLQSGWKIFVVLIQTINLNNSREENHVIHNDTGRLRVRHFRIMLRPAFITIFVLAIWLTLRYFGVYQSKDDGDATTNSLIPVYAAFHAIVAGFLLIRVMDEDARIHRAVDAKNVKRLWRELKRRIHPLVHILLLVFTTLIVKATMFLPYDSVWSGVEHVGGSSFALSLYWAVAIALDNPFSSPWVRDVIPGEMLEELLKLKIELEMEERPRANLTL